MSRIGRMPVAIPAGVTVDIAEGNKVTVKGAKGTLVRELPVENGNQDRRWSRSCYKTERFKEDEIPAWSDKNTDPQHGSWCSEGYEKVLEVNGVGYRAQKQGKKLVLSLGYSHPVEMEDPEGLETTVDGNKIVVKGISKEKVGQYAAEIREKRAPEPYKGKGIKYADEVIRRKVGKTGKK